MAIGMREDAGFQGKAHEERNALRVIERGQKKVRYFIIAE